MPRTPDDEAALTADIIALATQYGRYGYRRITVMLQRSGWAVGIKRVHRIWRREGLKVPHKQPKRGRLWLNDGSCIRLRPEHPNHVWSYDFVEDRTHNGRKYRMLNIIDEFTRECLAIRVSRKSQGRRRHRRADRPVYPARHSRPHPFRQRAGVDGKALRDWIAAVGASTAYIEPGSPLGERLLRELQLQAARRAAQRRDLLLLISTEN